MSFHNDSEKPPIIIPPKDFVVKNVSKANAGKEKLNKNGSLTKNLKPRSMKKQHKETFSDHENSNDVSAQKITSPEEPTPMDEDTLTHLVLSKILNRKKIQLMQCEEVRAAIRNMSHKKAKENEGIS